jgi:hypothetical protein
MCDESAGTEKINRHLFNADFMAYSLLGRSISGAEYQRLPKGPVPRPMGAVTAELKTLCVLAEGTRQYMGLQQTRLYALRDPDLSEFTSQEVDILNQVIQSCWGTPRNQINLNSYGPFSWKLVKEGEIIPYETIFLSDRELTKKEASYALRLASAA